MKDFLTLQSIDSVFSHIRSFPLTPLETISLNESLNRHIANDFFAPEDLPGFDRVTVDGYAVNSQDTFGASESNPALLQIIGHCHVGTVPDKEISSGQAIRILTGAMLPKGADCAIMQEYVRQTKTDIIEITRPQAPYDHIICKDDDAKKGELLFKKGHRLRIQDLGILAAFGQCSLEVFSKPNVAIISTGDEVIPYENTPKLGEVRNVNGITVSNICKSSNSNIIMGGIIKDDPNMLYDAISKHIYDNDVIVITGGSSAGMRDHTVSVFSKLPNAQLLVHGIAISPGKPFILSSATVNNRKIALVGLPGHTSSAFICAYILLRQLLKHMQGSSIPTNAIQIPAILTRSIASAQGRRDYIRVKLSHVQDKTDRYFFEATPILGSSGCISELTKSNGLLICPENIEGFDANEIVNIEIPWE